MSSTITTPSPTASTIIVDIADMKATNNPTARLTSSILGSCIALAIYDPEARVGGLLQYILPESHLDRSKALKNPFLFADTGIPMLFRRCYKLGAVKERIICRMAGGARIYDKSQIFDLAQCNQMAAREVLSNNSVTLASEKVGGRGGMKISLSMETGRVLVNLTSGEEFEL